MGACCASEQNIEDIRDNGLKPQISSSMTASMVETTPITVEIDEDTLRNFKMAIIQEDEDQLQEIFDEDKQLIKYFNTSQGEKDLVTSMQNVKDVDIMNIIIGQCATINQQLASSGKTCLMIAIQAGNLAFVKHLLSKGADTQVRDYKQRNAK